MAVPANTLSEMVLVRMVKLSDIAKQGKWSQAKADKGMGRYGKWTQAKVI